MSDTKRLVFAAYLLLSCIIWASCERVNIKEPPDMYYLALDGSGWFSFAKDELNGIPEVTSVKSSDPDVVRADGFEGDRIDFTGLAEGTATLFVIVEGKDVEMNITVIAPNRFELEIDHTPWPPCERFLPYTSEHGMIRWFKDEQALKGTRKEAKFASSDPDVASIKVSSWGEFTIDHLNVGSADLESEGCTGLPRRVVDVDDIIAATLWIDPRPEHEGGLVEENSTSEPLDSAKGSHSILVNGRDSSGALVCPHGALQVENISISLQSGSNCSLRDNAFDGAPVYLFHLSADEGETCGLRATIGDATSDFEIPFF